MPKQEKSLLQNLLFGLGKGAGKAKTFITENKEQLKMLDTNVGLRTLLGLIGQEVQSGFQTTQPQKQQPAQKQDGADGGVEKKVSAKEKFLDSIDDPLQRNVAETTLKKDAEFAKEAMEQGASAKEVMQDAGIKILQPKGLFTTQRLTSEGDIQLGGALAGGGQSLETIQKLLQLTGQEPIQPAQKEQFKIRRDELQLRTKNISSQIKARVKSSETNAMQVEVNRINSELQKFSLAEKLTPKSFFGGNKSMARFDEVLNRIEERIGQVSFKEKIQGKIENIDAVNRARAAGYSDEEINTFLKKGK